jgi:sec-independent protein translocase protein TatB
VFDVSFSELLVITIVALLVIGPEKLPKVARTLGALSGRFQRYVAQVKEEVNREVRFEELQKLQQEIKQGVQQTESSLNREVEKLADVPKIKARTKEKAIKKSSAKTPQAKV